jgi:hypothetical protein
VVIKITDAVSSAGMTAVSARGKDIYVGIIGANTEREPLGLKPIWPRTHPSGERTGGPNDDIADKTYTTTSEYFWDLYDGDNAGTTNWSPYVTGFDFSKLAGAGVRTPPAGATKADFLKGDYNMWNIIANLPDDAPNNTPWMFTKNLDITIEDLIAIENPDAIDPKNRLGAKVGTTVKQPYGKESFVIIRKGGGTYKAHPKHLATPRVFIGDADFKAWSELDPKPVILKASPDSLEEK